MTWWTAHHKQLEQVATSGSARASAAQFTARLDAVREGMFAQQAAFVDDDSDIVPALCSRRAGKSHGEFYRLGRIAAQCSAPGLFIATTLGVATQILDVPRQIAKEKYGIETEYITVRGLTYLVWPNGNRTWVSGCGDRGEKEKFRGPKYPLVVVDEAQSMAWLDDLCEDVLVPALLDMGGSLVIGGTPGPIPAGYWYDISTAPGVHHWTLRDNVHLPEDRDDWLRRLRERRKWTETTPRYRREYLGEWVLDLDAIVYPYDIARNGWEPMPDHGRVRTVLGVDLGSSGVTAWVVVSTVDGDHRVWVRHAESRRQQSTSDVAALTQAIAERWAADVVVVDAGGLGSAYVDDMRRRYGVSARAADKSTRDAAIQGLAGDLRSGVIRIDRQACRGLLEEMAGLVWDDLASQRAGKPVYSSQLPDHYCDALRYAWRECRVDYDPQREPPAPGTPEWYAAQAKRERERAVKAQRERLKGR